MAARTAIVAKKGPNQTSSVTPAITAVICTYNRYDVLSDAIGSLEAQSLAPEAVEILPAQQNVSSETLFLVGM